MITVSEYAEARGKTVQAVYKQMKGKRNAALLKGHVHEGMVNNKKTSLLDDEAVRILDEASHQSVQIITQTEEKARVDELLLEKERLESENKTLLLKVAALQEELLKEKDAVKSLQGEKIELLERITEKAESNQQQEAADKKWWQFWK